MLIFGTEAAVRAEVGNDKCSWLSVETEESVAISAGVESSSACGVPFVSGVRGPLHLVLPLGEGDSLYFGEQEVLSRRIRNYLTSDYWH